MRGWSTAINNMLSTLIKPAATDKANHFSR